MLSTLNTISQRPSAKRWLAPALAFKLVLCCLICGGATASIAVAQDGPSELEKLEKQRQEKEREAERAKSKGGLVLPRAKGGATPPAAGAEQVNATAPGATETNAAVPQDTTPDAILVKLAALTSFQASEARGYAEELLAHGEAGLAAARRGLSSDAHPVLLSCARAVLLAQDPAGMGLLRARLARDLPAEAIAPLLRAVDELAPASMSAPDLVALLDHPQATMRSAVERLLSERLTAVEVPLLARALSAERTDTRIRALGLLGTLSGDAALDLVFAQLADGRPQVAQRAAEILATRPELTVATRLQSLAFDSSAIFRGQAYAMLALVEREDLRGEALIGDERVSMLVENLASVSVFSRGVAAVALAGIGYRNTKDEEPQWFRLSVPHELVSILAGNEYHRDFAALQTSAQRRLERISGRTFGNDGPAWRAWWVNEASNFAPRRAALPGGERAVARIYVDWIGMGGESIRMAAENARVPSTAVNSVLWLDEVDARDLVAALEREGLLSAARLPAAPRADALERLSIAVGGLEKSFAFPLGLRPDFVDHFVVDLRRLAAANDWQELHDPLVAGGGRALFVEHAASWRALRGVDGVDGERRRAEQRKHLALAALVTMDPVKRGDVLAVLIDVARIPGVIDAADTVSLLRIVESEPYHSPRTTQVVQLLLDAAREGLDQPVDLDFGRDLFDRLYERFRGGGFESLELVARSVGLEFARELSHDGRALARAMSADMLAASSAPDDLARLELLVAEGEVELVQEAALKAMGDRHRYDLRHLVTARAELAPPRVRRAAVTALGELGGAGVLETLVTCFATDDVDLQRSALLAISKLPEPQAAEVVVQMLGRGVGHALFATAREACLAMGERVRLPLVDLTLQERAPGRAEAAFVLAELGVAEAVPALLALLAQSGPSADRAASELAVLSCMDLAKRDDRTLAWAAWWEGAAQRDPLVWLRDAQIRLGLPVAPPGSLETGGTRDGALALAASVAAPAGVVSERARRELARLLGTPVKAPPVGGDLARWREDLDAAIDRRYSAG